MELKIDSLKLSEQATSQIVEGVLDSLGPLVEIYLSKFNSKDYLSLGETTEYLSISRGTLSSLIKDGLPVIKIGNVQKIKKTDLEEFLNQHKK